MRKWWPIAELVLIECVRRKDAYVALILGLAVVAPLTQIHAFGVTGAVRYLREVSLLLIWISSAVVTVAAATRQIPDELARGTVYPILSRPISRADFVVGKFVGVLVASTALLAVFYLLFVLVSGTTAGEWLPSGIAQGFVLHVCFLAVVAAAALLLSIVLTPAACVTLVLLVAATMLLLHHRLNELVSDAGALRLPAALAVAMLPHLELFDLRTIMVHDWPPLPFTLVAALVAYAVLYTAGLLLIAVLLFRRKAL